MINIYKYVHGIYDVSANYIDYSIWARVHQNQRSPAENPGAASLRQAFFSIRIVDLWNSLTEHVVLAPSMNAFKSRLDKHWSHVPFLYNYRDYQGFLTGRMRTTNQITENLLEQSIGNCAWSTEEDMYMYVWKNKQDRPSCLVA